MKHKGGKKRKTKRNTKANDNFGYRPKRLTSKIRV